MKENILCKENEYEAVVKCKFVNRCRSTPRADTCMNERMGTLIEYSNGLIGGLNERVSDCEWID